MSHIAYAGIGSRKTPEDVLTDMRKLAKALARADVCLVSGGAAGADTAFEEGCGSLGKKAIYLPWKNFKGHSSSIYQYPPAMYAEAENHHPKWDFLLPRTRNFMARNVAIILGLHMDMPVDFVLCWTPEGKADGGTGHSIRCAEAHDIPVFNMATMTMPDIKDRIDAIITAKRSKE